MARLSSSRSRHYLLAAWPLALLLLAACSDSDSAGDTTGASGQGGSGGASGQGGSGGSGTSGASGQGGKTDSTGGSAGTAGKGGSAGQAGSAGSSGSAGKGGTAQGGSAGVGGSAGQAGISGSSGQGGKIACSTTNDCVGFIPETKPASCAKAECDPTQKFCRFVAKDIDGDGDPSNTCQSQDPGIIIELGGDCDEGDDKVNSKAWDGPEGVFEGKAQVNRCDDTIDQDCSGTPNDGKLDDGTTCLCVPDDVRKCSEDSAGKKIVFPGGTPQGECKLGSQTCQPSGKWGPCTDAVGPTAEECNGGKDDDCDGQADDLDPDVSNQKLWLCDGDNDNFAAVGAQPTKSCEVPTKGCEGASASWKLDIPTTDCNDSRADVNPNAPEVCDVGDANPDKKAADENCNGLANEICTCENGKEQLCFVDPTNQLIPHNGDLGIGECKPGKQTCVSGSWGPCLGGLGPAAEVCANEGKDNDCDGDAVETNGAVAWYWAADGDQHGDIAFAPVVACDAPTAAPEGCQPGPTTDCDVGPDKWRSGIKADDCNDTDPTTSPEAKEVCDGEDNNCNGLKDDNPTNVATWYFDGDQDGHVAGNTTTQEQCSNPGIAGQGCLPGVSSCPELWTSKPLSKADCNDASSDVYPGAWDGPETLTVGMKNGWKIEYFPRTSSTYQQAPGVAEVAAATVPAIALIDANWGRGRPHPAVPTDHWVARVTGTLVTSAPATPSGDPTYTFKINADDGVRLWIDGAPCIDSWINSSFLQRTCDAKLAPGEHDVRVEYYENGVDAALRVRWLGPGITEQTLKIVSQVAHPNRCGDGKQDCNESAADNSSDKTDMGEFKCGQGQLSGTCVPGTIEPFNTSGKSGIGVCRNGWRQCSSVGLWGPTNDEILPSAEVCDDLDNDCDGTVDNGYPTNTWYQNIDGDAYDGDVRLSCKQPSGTNWSPNKAPGQPVGGKDIDDNDNDKTIYPGAPELCDGKDNDQDSVTDDLTVGGVANKKQGDKCNVAGKTAGSCANGGTVTCPNTSSTGVCQSDNPAYNTSTPQSVQGNGTWDWNCNGVVNIVGPGGTAKTCNNYQNENSCIDATPWFDPISLVEADCGTSKSLTRRGCKWQASGGGFCTNSTTQVSFPIKCY
jgi:hypothetical protein